MTPIFSPSMGSEKRLNASLISPSSCAETLCSFASLERGAAFGVEAVLAEALPPAFRFGGWLNVSMVNGNEDLESDHGRYEVRDALLKVYSYLARSVDFGDSQMLMSRSGTKHGVGSGALCIESTLLKRRKSTSRISQLLPSSNHQPNRNCKCNPTALHGRLAHSTQCAPQGLSRCNAVYSIPVNSKPNRFKIC
jgi:hypothetical protein